MGFERRGEAVVAALEFDELKLIYRVLHQSLGDFPELLDSDFLEDLQDFLHQQARADGVDGTDHGQWDRWLQQKSTRGR